MTKSKLEPLADWHKKTAKNWVKYLGLSYETALLIVRSKYKRRVFWYAITGRINENN